MGGGSDVPGFFLLKVAVGTMTGLSTTGLVLATMTYARIIEAV